MPTKIVRWGTYTWGGGAWSVPEFVAEIAQMSKNILTYDPTTTDTRTSGSLSIESDSNTIQFANDNAVVVDYTIEGTYDGDDFTHAYEIATGSVTATSTAVEYLTNPWNQFRVSVTPQNTPSEGNVLSIKLHEGE